MNELYLAAALGLVLAGEWLYRSGGSREAQAVGLAALLAALVCLPAALSEPAAVRAMASAVSVVLPWGCLLLIPLAALAAWRCPWPGGVIRWYMLAALAASGMTLLWPAWLSHLVVPLIDIFVIGDTSKPGGAAILLPAVLAVVWGVRIFLFAFYAAVPLCLGLMLVYNARWPGLRYAGIALLAFGALLWLAGVISDVVFAAGLTRL